MTKLKLFPCLLLFFIINTINAQFPRDAAIDFVKNQVLNNELSHIRVYASIEPKSGSTGLLLLHDNPIQFPYNSNWVFFVDDHPLAGWNHSCRYIFIDAITGSDTIVGNQQIYPIGLGKEFEDISDTPPFQPCESIYAQPPPVNNPAIDENSHLYAVIIAGIEDDPTIRPPQSWNDISAVYTTLEKVYGYKKESMFVHCFDGTAFRGKDLDGGLYSKDIDYAAYKDTIYHTFKCLSGEETDPLIPKLEPDDQLFIYVDDHGGVGANNSWIYLPTDPHNPLNPYVNLYDTTLAKWVQNIECGQMIFLLEPCYSGGFVNDLQTNDSAKCKNRSIYTSAAYNEKEWMDFHISDTT